MTGANAIYLDHQAHAPIDPRALASLNDAFARLDYNPHSSHGPGEAARTAMDLARASIAAAINAQPAEIVFVSGATEANNLAFAGSAPSLRQAGRTRIVVSAGEHPSILEAAEGLQGFSVDTVRLASGGAIDLNHLAELLGPDVGLVSIAAANHEIGTIQPLDEIARMVAPSGALLHSDLAQAFGKIPVSAPLLDLASLSSHKMGGPSGIGALYCRRKLRRRLSPLLRGGGQEGGLRSGTVPVPLCVGFAAATEIAVAEMITGQERVGHLRDRLLEGLRPLGGVVVNGRMEARLAGNLNVSFEGVDGEALVMTLRDRIAVSTGSACTSASLEPSHVLAAIGMDERQARGAVRFSLGPPTSEDEVRRAVEMVGEAVTALRSMIRKVA